MQLETCYDATLEDYLELKEMMPIVLEHQVVKRFLEIEKNRNLFSEVLEKYDKEKIRMLNEEFEKFKIVDSYIGYMKGYAKRFAIDYDKRAKLKNSRFQLTMDSPVGEGTAVVKDLIGDTKSSPYVVLERRENDRELGIRNMQNEKLKKAMETLDEKLKKIVSLHYEEGFTYGEIAKLFGQTHQNIAHLCKKAREQLRLQMIEEG